MIDCPYFWGKITHEEAMEILEGKPTGSIILRESNPIEDDHTTRNILDVIEFIRTGNVNHFFFKINADPKFVDPASRKMAFLN